LNQQFSPCIWIHNLLAQYPPPQQPVTLAW